MNKRFMRRILLLGLLFGIACATDKKNDECSSDECLKQQAYDKVIAVHDEVMPNLSKISSLMEQIEEKMKVSSDSAEIKKYVSLMQDLDAADDAMWVWMRAFNSDIETMEIESALNYLAAEQKKIDLVAQKISESLNAAEAAIN